MFRQKQHWKTSKPAKSPEYDQSGTSGLPAKQCPNRKGTRSRLVDLLLRSPLTIPLYVMQRRNKARFRRSRRHSVLYRSNGADCLEGMADDRAPDSSTSTLLVQTVAGCDIDVRSSLMTAASVYDYHFNEFAASDTRESSEFAETGGLAIGMLTSPRRSSEPQAAGSAESSDTDGGGSLFQGFWQPMQDTDGNFTDTPFSEDVSDQQERQKPPSSARIFEGPPASTTRGTGRSAKYKARKERVQVDCRSGVEE